MQLVFEDLRSNRPKPLDSCNFNSLPVHKRFMSLPNTAVLKNSTVEAPAIEWKSMPNVTQAVVDDIQDNKQKPSESSDYHSVSLEKRFLSLPNMAVGANSEGDSLEVGLPSIMSAELLVSADSPCVGSSAITTLMTPAAAAVEDSGIEKPLSVVSSSLPLVQ